MGPIGIGPLSKIKRAPPGAKTRAALSKSSRESFSGQSWSIDLKDMRSKVSGSGSAKAFRLMKLILFASGSGAEVLPAYIAH